MMNHKPYRKKCMICFFSLNPFILFYCCIIFFPCFLLVVEKFIGFQKHTKKCMLSDFVSIIAFWWDSFFTLDIRLYLYNLLKKRKQFFHILVNRSALLKKLIFYDGYFGHTTLVSDRHRRWHRWILLHLWWRFLTHLRMGLIWRWLCHVRRLRTSYILRRFARQNHLRIRLIWRWFYTY